MRFMFDSLKCLVLKVVEIKYVTLCEDNGNVKVNTATSMYTTTVPIFTKCLIYCILAYGEVIKYQVFNFEVLNTWPEATLWSEQAKFLCVFVCLICLI